MPDIVVPYQLLHSLAVACQVAYVADSRNVNGESCDGEAWLRLAHCTGTLVHWHTGTLAHWHTGTLHWHTGTPPDFLASYVGVIK